jgi:hypothetical protein
MRNYLKIKICHGCGKKYPATLEYFKKLSSVKSGLNYKCKKCTSTKKHKGCGVCPICNKKFEKNTKKQKTCGNRECVLKLYSSTTKKKYKEGEYELRTKNRADKICAFCGEKFTAIKSDNQKYCSHACRYGHYSPIVRNRYRKLEMFRRLIYVPHEKYYINECKFCGDLFDTKTPYKKYCSKQCWQYKTGELSARFTFICRGCGKDYLLEINKHGAYNYKYCEECAPVMRGKIRRDYKKQIIKGLSNSYIKDKLSRQLHPMGKAIISAELIDTKRKQIRIHRMIYNKQ